MDTDIISRQLEEAAKRRSLLAGDMEDTRKESGRLKEEYEKLEQGLADLEGQIASDRQELNQETVSKGSLEGRINVLNEQIHTCLLYTSALPLARGLTLQLMRQMWSL